MREIRFVIFLIVSSSKINLSFTNKNFIPPNNPSPLDEDKIRKSPKKSCFLYFLRRLVEISTHFSVKV